MSLRLIATLAVMLTALWRSDDVAAAEPFVARPGEQHLLLLQNGRIVTGEIHHTARGYFVQTATGNMVIPNTEVRLEAVDLQDAYKKQRYLMTAPTASLRLNLAKWCLTHKLYAQARRELRDALILEPDRGDIRRMLVRIEQAIDPSRVRKEMAPRAQPRDVAGFELPPAQSLAGLSRETAREYIRRVQPILMNKCSNLNCHGANAPNDLRLIHVRLGHGRNKTNAERNLAAVLRFVDFDQPAASPLLTKPRGKHGTLRGEVFPGTQGRKQLDILKAWVAGVAKEDLPAVVLQVGSSSATPASRGAATRDAVDANAARPLALLPNVALPSEAFPSVTIVGPFSETVHALLDAEPVGRSAGGSETPKQLSHEAEEAFFRELMRGRSNDAFDPDEFNRQPIGPS